ncbi:MAG: helix-turn-helix domain-containing protein [Atopobiaceae bacterium]|nr:helix-turn-helix domain-containing protein [Atopobiaceae bacterium]
MAYRHVRRLNPQEVQALPACLNTEEACGILGTQPNTLQRLVRQGRVPASKIGGRLLFSKRTVCELAGLTDKEAANE